MALVPTTRNQAVALAEAMGEEALSEEQIAGFKRLYRLSDDRTISELIASGEIVIVTDEDIVEFIRDKRIYGITGRAGLDHSRAFLKQISSPAQIAFLRAELPRILRGYYLQDLMGVLNEIIIPESGGCKCGGKCSCITEGMENETEAINRFQREDLP